MIFANTGGGTSSKTTTNEGGGTVGDNIPIAGDDLPKVPDGRYQVTFKRGTINRLYRENRFVAEFEIYDPGGEHHAVALPFYAAICAEGGKVKPNPRKKYFRAWSLANGGKPKRGDRMSPKVFKGKLFTAEVGTVESNGTEYSCVRELLSVENRIQGGA